MPPGQPYWAGRSDTGSMGCLSCFESVAEGKLGDMLNATRSLYAGNFIDLLSTKETQMAMLYVNTYTVNDRHFYA